VRKAIDNSVFFHKAYGLELPRRYKRKTGRDYLVFAQSKKIQTRKSEKHFANNMDMWSEILII
jgi:hypothetical protein